MLVALVWLPLLIALGVWVVVFVASRYVSLASICGAFVLPFAAWLTGENSATIFVIAALAALAIYKHKANIQRLIAGTENRIGVNKATTDGHR